MGAIGSSELLRRCPGVTYRQLDYWCRTGVLEPLVPARGSGCPRRFATPQVQVVRLVATLSSLGAEQPALARAAQQAESLAEHWWRVPVVVSADGDLSGEASLKAGGYLVDLAAMAEAYDGELLSA